MQASAPVCVVTHNTDGVRRDALLHRGNRREMINRVDWPMHKLYSVNADVDTGHWLDTPEPLGEVSLAEFDKLSDTPDATFTTFEINGETAADHCAMADSQITASLCSST